MAAIELIKCLKGGLSPRTNNQINTPTSPREDTDRNNESMNSFIRDLNPVMNNNHTEEIDTNICRENNAPSRKNEIKEPPNNGRLNTQQLAL